MKKKKKQKTVIELEIFSHLHNQISFIAFQSFGIAVLKFKTDKKKQNKLDSETEEYENYVCAMQTVEKKKTQTNRTDVAFLLV